MKYTLIFLFILLFCNSCTSSTQETETFKIIWEGEYWAKYGVNSHHISCYYSNEIIHIAEHKAYHSNSYRGGRPSDMYSSSIGIMVTDTLLRLIPDYIYKRAIAQGNDVDSIPVKEYISYSPNTEQYFLCRMDGWDDQSRVFRTVYTELKKIKPSVFSEGVACVKIHHKYGFINDKGVLIIDAIFDDANSFSEGLAVVKIGDKYGFINDKGVLIIDAIFDDANSFSEGLAVVKIGDKYGYIDKSGEVIIEPYYDYASSFYNGLAEVTKDFRTGWINKLGAQVIPPIYMSTGEFNDNELVYVSLPGSKSGGYIDVLGKEVVPIGYYDRISDRYSDGLIWVKTNGKYGYLDTDGLMVIPPIYDAAESFIDNMAIVKYQGKVGCINKNGDVVIDFIFEKIEPFSEGLAVINLNGKYGYINKVGKIVIDTIYDAAESFSEGLAVVKIGNKYGYINKRGNIIISPQYEKALDFRDEVAQVSLDGKRFYFIDKSGNFFTNRSGQFMLDDKGNRIDY